MSEPPSPAPISSSSSSLQLLLVLVFRLLLVSVGGGLAFFAGVAIARFYPQPNPQMPLIERLVRRGARIVSGNRRQTAAPLPLPALPLTPEKKNSLQARLNQIQAELQRLGDRAAALETELDSLSYRPAQLASDSLETRLQAMERLLEPNRTQSAWTTNSLMVTLPGDILFLEDRNTLRSDRQGILESIVTELQNYQGASIRIAAHTDNVGDARDNLELSLQRARAVKQYLAEALGDEYKWVAVGYGESRPLAGNDTEFRRQRNRRIEIAIDS